MAKILVLLDERSVFITELAGPAGPTVQAINAGHLPVGLSLPASHKRVGRLVAVQQGELVIVTWKGSVDTGETQDLSLPAGMDLPSGGLPFLTFRETQVLQLLAEGLNHKQIGERLSLTERTIRHYIHTLNAKLGTQSPEQSVARGVMLGLCHLPTQRPSD